MKPKLTFGMACYDDTRDCEFSTGPFPDAPVVTPNGLLQGVCGYCSAPPPDDYACP